MKNHFFNKFLYKTIQLIKRHSISILAVLVISLDFIILVTQRQFYQIPNWDVFQYINDSRTYMSLNLPHDIWAPPGNPLIIGLVSSVFKFSSYYELNNAIFINIIFSTISLFLFWKILKVFVGNYYLLLLVLLVTKPTYHLMILKGSSEILFTFFVFLTLYLRLIKKFRLSYLVAGISFLFRYEAIALLIPLILCDLFNKKPFWKNVKLFLYGILPVLSIFLLISIKNTGGNILGNHYIVEIIQGRKQIPNFETLRYVPNVFFGELVTINSSVVYLFFSYLCYSLYSIYKKGERDLIIIVNFLILYIILHLVFPVFERRYLFPITPFLFFILLMPVYYHFLNKKLLNNISFSLFKTWFFSFCIFLILLNIIEVKKALISTDNKSDREILMLSKWMNNKQFPNDVYVVTYPHWIGEYFNKNSNVKFRDGIKNYYGGKIISNSNIIIVYDSFLDKNYYEYRTENFVSVLKAINDNPEKYNLHLLTTLTNGERWVKLYTNSDNIY